LAVRDQHSNCHAALSTFKMTATGKHYTVLIISAQQLPQSAHLLHHAVSKQQLHHPLPHAAHSGTAHRQIRPNTPVYLCSTVCVLLHLLGCGSICPSCLDTDLLDLSSMKTDLKPQRILAKRRSLWQFQHSSSTKAFGTFGDLSAIEEAVLCPFLPEAPLAGLGRLGQQCKLDCSV
jgi:hypothetical protein